MHHYSEAFDWYFRLSFSRRAAVDAAIRVLLAAKYGTPYVCLMAIFEAKHSRR